MSHLPLKLCHSAMVTFWKWWSLRRNRSTVNLHLHESHETSRKSPNCKIVNKRLLLLSVVNLLGTTQWRRWRERFAVAYFLLSTNLLFPADTNTDMFTLQIQIKFKYKYKYTTKMFHSAVAKPNIQTTGEIRTQLLCCLVSHCHCH